MMCSTGRRRTVEAASVQGIVEDAFWGVLGAGSDAAAGAPDVDVEAGAEAVVGVGSRSLVTESTVSETGMWRITRATGFGHPACLARVGTACPEYGHSDLI